MPRLLPALAPALAALGLALPSAALAATGPTVNVVDGVVRVSGTAGDDGFTLDEGGPTTVWITATAPGAVFSTIAGSGCTVSAEHASCAVPAPADVVFDLGAGGADGVERDPLARGVRSVTASYEIAGAPLRYTGGTPATAAVGGATGTLRGVDAIVGTPFADTLTGGPAAERLAGGGGDDVIDVATAGGPADVVDCGAGRDAVTYRPGVDTQSACEVLNGVDPTAPPAAPPAAPTAPPAPMIVFTPPPPAPPAVKVPAKVAGATIPLVLTCPPAGCAAQDVVVQPPAFPPGKVPSAWSSAAPAADQQRLEALMRALAGTLDREDAQRALQQALQFFRSHSLGTPPTSSSFTDVAAPPEWVQAASAAAISGAILQATVIASGGTAPPVVARLDGHRVTVPTPLTGVRLPAPGRAAAAASRRAPTARAFTRWLLARTAGALPRVRTTLRRTATPGVYRATLKAPGWLRGTGRVLRRTGARALPVDLQVGATRTRVRLPLPR